MSDTTNHKKAIAITRSCRGNRGLITDIYYKILEDHPAAIVNAFEGLRGTGGAAFVCNNCIMVTSNKGGHCEHCGAIVD